MIKAKGETAEGQRSPKVLRSSDQASASAVMEGKTRAAPSSASTAGSRGPVLTAMVKMPAATAARTPRGAFSTTKVCHGRRLPALASPMR